MRILTVNAGSSSLKLSVFADEELLGTEDLPVRGVAIDAAAVRAFVDRFKPLEAVGHRIVHGGTEFTEPVRLDASVRARLDALTDLAPLHQPKSLRALDVVSHLLPDLPAVAAFDTSFHANLPAAAATYAIPPEWRTRWALRRYGFHGLSHAYASRRVGERIAPSSAPFRVVTCHLGAGSSLAAVRDGRSLDTTMGFTPLEGLVMGTRSGTVDPGLLLWLEEHTGMPPSELAATLERRSGLLALAGVADMREVLSAEAREDPDAILAISVYLHRLRASIAAMTAALGGLDALVFTGGIGEHSAPIRARAADGLGYLGIRIDPAKNGTASGEAEIGATGAAVRTWVIPAREDLEIARAVRHVLRPVSR